MPFKDTWGELDEFARSKVSAIWRPAIAKHNVVVVRLVWEHPEGPGEILLKIEHRQDLAEFDERTVAGLVNRATIRIVDPSVSAFDDLAVVAIATTISGNVSGRFIKTPVAEQAIDSQG